MEPLFEQREYPTGIQYVQTLNPIPGQVYFVARMDPMNQVYYAPQVYQPAPQMVVQSTTVTQQPMMQAQPQTVVLANSGFGGSSAEVASAISLHLGITITCVFFPGLIYLIGFPFCFVRYRNLIRSIGEPDHLRSKLNAYSGVGWFTWILHLAWQICICTFWIPSCKYYYSSFGGYYYTCNFVGGIVALSVISLLLFIFEIVVISVGADLGKVLQNAVISGTTNIVVANAGPMSTVTYVPPVYM